MLLLNTTCLETLSGTSPLFRWGFAPLCTLLSFALYICLDSTLDDREAMGVRLGQMPWERRALERAGCMHGGRSLAILHRADSGNSPWYQVYLTPETTSRRSEGIPRGSCAHTSWRSDVILCASDFLPPRSHEQHRNMGDAKTNLSELPQEGHYPQPSLEFRNTNC